MGGLALLHHITGHPHISFRHYQIIITLTVLGLADILVAVLFARDLMGT
jgi:hypothetical protein